MEAEAHEFKSSTEKQRSHSTDEQTIDIQDITPYEKQLDFLGAEANYLQPQITIDTESEHEMEAFDLFDPNSEEIRKVRWKVDRRLVPLLSLLYLCSFLDRSNIGNAKVANLGEDLKLHSGVYNVALSVFFVGYIIGEVPASMALKKVGPRIWVSIVMICWGTVSVCMAAVRSGTGLIVARFFLGLTES
ncbi:hypothetical protein BGZ80_001674, partial [Entomortierella chlamydospora]